MKFAQFDARGYRTLTVRAGYAAWAPDYDRHQRGVPLATGLLARLPRNLFRQARQAIDLGCGTGRIGVWLRRRWVGVLDGVDATSAMLERARTTGVYRRLRLGDLRRGPERARGYGLAVCSLVACHLSALGPIYRRMHRLVRHGGTAVLVDYHPHFLLNGIPTHFPTPSGQVAITNHVHLLGDHVRAALAAGWRLKALEELTVPARVVRLNAAWKRFVGRPISFMVVLESRR